MRASINGILLLDKPDGLSSNTALQRAKRLFNAKKAGHTGSLDPLATGMLPICFGEATKFSQYLLDADKTYYVTAKLGAQTPTGDLESEIIKTCATDHITEAHIQQVFSQFLGEHDQTPPMFSALKHQGQPLYELARKGIEIERKARRITIFSLTLHEFAQDSFTFSVCCSKGTYIRVLVEDIARALNSYAHVTVLRRLSVNPFGDSIMYTLPALESIAETLGADGLLQCLLPLEISVQAFPVLTLSPSSAYYLRTGRSIEFTLPVCGPLVKLVTEDFQFLGIGEVCADRIKPHRLVAEKN